MTKKLKFDKITNNFLNSLSGDQRDYILMFAKHLITVPYAGIFEKGKYKNEQKKKG